MKIALDALDEAVPYTVRLGIGGVPGIPARWGSWTPTFLRIECDRNGRVVSVCMRPPCVAWATYQRDHYEAHGVFVSGPYHLEILELSNDAGT